jgi:hypothetical protein
MFSVSTVITRLFWVTGMDMAESSRTCFNVLTRYLPGSTKSEREKQSSTRLCNERLTFSVLYIYFNIFAISGRKRDYSGFSAAF